MGMTKKIPVKDLAKADLKPKIQKLLSEDAENAYTISGIMVDALGVKESDIHNKPFGKWPKGAPTLYTRTRWVLGKLVKEGNVKTVRDGKRDLYYWVGA